MATTEQKISMIANELKGRLGDDSGVPRNIRKGASDAVSHLMNTSKPVDLRISNAINILDELSNDPNIPMESWSTIAKILSDLEEVLKEVN
jgi:uncharacterized protein (UPF0147 family)